MFSASSGRRLWPAYRLWLPLLFLVTGVAGQATLTGEADGSLSNGCSWDDRNFELACPGNLGLERLPYVHPNISSVTQKLRLVGHKLETVTIEEISNFSSLEVLDLRSNSIQTVDDLVFSRDYLPKLQQLFLAENKLKWLPQDVFKGTNFRTLDLSSNQLDGPPLALNRTQQIDSLYLNKNPFAALRKGDLDGITNLQTLDLSECNLSMDNLDPAVFSPFLHLRTLALDKNHFPLVPRRLFAHISSLTDLYMQKCGIQEFESRAWIALNRLAGLHLSRNNITELQPNSFKKINLINLDLSYCGIQNIKKGAFRTKIEGRLYLEGNNISVIHAEDFKALTGVAVIRFGNSNVSQILGSPFSHLKHLQELHLENNQLTDESVEGDKLNCSGPIHTLDLSGNRLTRIPNVDGKHFPKLEQLFIGRNNISYIGDTDLRNMTSLLVLVLRENPIRIMHKDAFAECKKVTVLNIDYIKVKVLPDMRHMVKLSDMHIIGGELEYFPDDLCTTNSKLLIIEATHNHIQKLIDFSGCTKLFSLSLDNNEIKEIPVGYFAGLSRLDILELEGNFIEHIAPGVFDDLSVLRALTLHKNMISELPTGIFDQLTALRVLNLGYNRIHKLEKGIFTNNTLLQQLWLNNNNIDEVHPETFEHMMYLERLNMSSNYFCSLEFPQLGFPSLRVLSLEELWCLHKVPNPHEMPSAKTIYYTYAYHCCL